MNKIYIIEEDFNWRTLLGDALTEEFRLTFWSNGENIFSRLQSEQYNLIILDLGLKKANPKDLLIWIKSTMANVPVVVTNKEDKNRVVNQVIRLGASDFIAKPYSSSRIHLAVHKAIQTQSLLGEIHCLRHEQDLVYDFNRIIAFSSGIKKKINTLKKFAPTDATVFLTGETGTGKSFLSGSVHHNSARRDRPFVKINCCNIPETLLESELFGHEKGAFTGAYKDRIGRFQMADGGTIFLDEIGELSPTLQGKLLRVLEEKTFERVGGGKLIQSNVRIIAATNMDLEARVRAGVFREDLFYRINILNLNLPPLRDRRKCIEPLSYKFLENCCRRLKKKVNGFSEEVIQMFNSYSWPGNIRQLANTIERAVIISDDGQMIEAETVALDGHAVRGKNAEIGIAEPQTPVTLKENEKDRIIDALAQADWIQKEAARRLGVSPRAFNYKIKKFGITNPGWRKNR